MVNGWINIMHKVICDKCGNRAIVIQTNIELMLGIKLKEWVCPMLTCKYDNKLNENDTHE
jgi:hypothetical protein